MDYGARGYSCSGAHLEGVERRRVREHPLQGAPGVGASPTDVLLLHIPAKQPWSVGLMAGQMDHGPPAAAV